MTAAPPPLDLAAYRAELEKLLPQCDCIIVFTDRGVQWIEDEE